MSKTQADKHDSEEKLNIYKFNMRINKKKRVFSTAVPSKNCCSFWQPATMIGSYATYNKTRDLIGQYPCRIRPSDPARRILGCLLEWNIHYSTYFQLAYIFYNLPDIAKRES